MKMDIAKSWNILESILRVQENEGGAMSSWSPVHATEELRDSIILLASRGMCELLQEWMYETIFNDLSKRVAPAFWNFFTHIGEDPEKNREEFCCAFELLHDVYSKYYMVAIKRLDWLKTLASSAPAIKASSTSSGRGSSAFIPVKAGISHKNKGIRSGVMQGNRGLSSSFGGSMSERNGREVQLSVTFEKGTKGSDMETEMTDQSLEEQSCREGADMRRTNSLDGSYVHGKQMTEHSLWSDSSTQSLSLHSQQDFNPSTDNPNLLSTSKDDEDDIESFIRSPIGGNKKLMAAAKGMNPVVPETHFMAVTPSLTPHGQTLSATNSVSAVQAPSQTSTPGLMLSHTLGPITPIAYHDSPDAFSHISEDTGGLMEGASQQSVTIQNNCNSVDDSKGELADSLPSASEIFGVAVASRPMPGASVRWPNAEHQKGFSGAKCRVSEMIRAVLFHTFPKNFVRAIGDYYSKAFAIHKTEMEISVLEQSMQDARNRNSKLHEMMDSMGLMELISGSAVTEIVHSQIENHIQEECRGNFDTSFLTELEEWLDNHILCWLNEIYAEKQTASQLASVEAFRDRLRHFIYETYAKSLIGQFFDIIIDYPDSKPAIVDLCDCLEKTNLRTEFVTSLKSALENRLLHPGVNTADILTAYIAAIKSLRLLEPAGVILELVCEPVGRYLRSREDTVRCIVASLTDEGNNELVSELVRTKPVGEENIEGDGNLKDWEDWMPDPVDADPSTTSKNRRSADILSTLVNIYGSKELFVNEYRALLADRILMQYNYDVERELRYLELLKLRFGEAQLHFCEVMLRDVTESRRVNARIQDSRKEPATSDDVDMNAMILSAQFWPAFRDEKIKLPLELQGHLDRYTRAFETQKQNRTLVWKSHLGMMNIELELKEETLNFSVSPVQAAIIMKFQTKTKWSVEELCLELEMTASVLRRKIAFWQGQGLLRESSPDEYQLVEERKGRPHDLIMVDEEEMESAMASAQQQKEEEMQVFWTYIQGMLANLDCLTLERIHSMLKMFAMEESSSSEVSLQELKTFLDNKVKDQILIFSGGVYRLNK